MLDLLSNSERDEIRDALANTLYTYAKTPIQLILKGSSLDRFNEDRADIVKNTYDFNAYVEYKNGDKVKDGVNLGGAYDNADIKIMIPISDVEDAGLISDSAPTINATTSDVLVNGEAFELVHTSLEGAFERRDVAVYIWAKRNERYAG